jgi:AcrR family transcriptional regulator
MSRSDRKDQIITAALELFRSKGFAAVSTRDLAEHAGLSRSHIYHYFADWNELRREAFIRFAQQQLDAVRAPLAGATPSQALHGFLGSCLPADTDSGWSLWLDAWDEAMHEPLLAEIYFSINAEWQETLAQQIERGVASGEFRCGAPARAARQLFAVAMGYTDDLLLKPSAAARASALAEVMEVAELLLGTRDTAGAAAGP